MGYLNLIPYAIVVILYLVLLSYVLKKRYVKLTNMHFGLFFRKGELKRSGYGGAYFILPLIDELIILPASVQIINETIKKIPTIKGELVEIEYSATWKIDGDPSKVYREFGTIGDEQNINVESIIRERWEAFLRDTIYQLPFTKVITDTTRICQNGLDHLSKYFSEKGITLESVNIKNVRRI